MPTTANPIAGAGARTPDATPDATRTALREARRQNALRLERIRESRLAVIEHRESRRRQLTESLSIDWVTPYAELLDLTRRTGDPVIAGPTAAWQRRQGKNWPIYQTEQELNLLRAPARVLFGTNGYAQGLVEGIKSYVLGTGNTYRIAKEDDQDDLPDDAVDAAQNVVDKFLLRTQWFGGELPGIEEELLERSMVDGEFILCHYPREDGTTDVRTQEPEMLTCPPHGDWREWSFGVRTPYDDAQDQQAFWVQHGDSPEEGEEYSPDEVTFFRRNVTRAMKRGVTDFCFDTYDALYLAGRLRTNLGDTAAQQAAIVAVRQHDSGTKEDIQSFIDADATFTQTEPLTGSQIAQKIHRRGSWEDIPKGMNYVPGPTATSTPIHLQVLDACLRGAGQKWQAPPWLMSGDLNAMNYATSLTAESPFVRTVQRRQRSYCEAFRRPVWFALRHWVQTNGLRDRTGRVWSWDEIEGRIKLQVTAPSPETRDKLQDAQRAQIEIPLGVQSRQGYMQEQGRNVDQVEADNQAYQDKFGSDGQQLPLPGADGAAPGGAGGAGAGARTSADTDALPSLESLLESEGDGTFSVELLEADAPPGKVWKVITVTRGGKQFQQKRLVNAPKAGSEKKKAKAKDDPKKGKGPAKPDPKAITAAVKAQLAGDPKKLTPAKIRDLGEKLKGLSVEQIKAIKAEHDLKGGKTKADHIAKLLDRAKELKKKADAAKKEKATPTGKPTEKPAETPPAVVKPAEAKPIDYQQTNPDHPVAKAIREDAESAAIVTEFTRRVKEIGGVGAAHEQWTRATAERDRISQEITAKGFTRARNVLLQKALATAGETWQRYAELTEKTTHTEVRKQATEHLQELLRPRAPSKVTNYKVSETGQGVEPIPDNSPHVAAIRTSTRFVESILNGSPLAVHHAVAVDGRAFARPQKDGTTLIAHGETRKDDDGRATVVVHELGHAIEAHKPGVAEMAQAFVAYRCGAEAETNLLEKFGGTYHPSETGRKDHFDRAFGDSARAYYVGKVYPTGDTEVVSMGLELMFRDPAGFAQRDPEYFQFMVSVLRK